MPSARLDERIVAAEAEQLLYREARLLDERRYAEWLELFTEDGLYWLPIHANGGEADPRTAISIVHDDAERRGERVFRALETPVLDQNPPSRTVHLVSNVEVEPGEAGDGARVFCAQLIAEVRPGGPAQVGLNEPRSFAARCEYRLRREDGELRIALKKVALLESDQPIYNLTFIV
jgi:ethylbenzene dioxygenase beta subunit